MEVSMNWWKMISVFFKDLFDYDFRSIEKDLGISCFSQISNYKAIHKKDLMYNKNVSEKVRSLSKKLEAAKDEKEFFDAVTGFYKDYGVGMFGLNKAFRIDDTPQGSFTFRAINNMDTVMLDDLVGYEIQKKEAGRQYGSVCTGKEKQTMYCCLVTVVPVNLPVSKPLSTSITKTACV